MAGWGSPTLALLGAPGPAGSGGPWGLGTVSPPTSPGAQTEHGASSGRQVRGSARTPGSGPPSPAVGRRLPVEPALHSPRPTGGTRARACICVCARTCVSECACTHVCVCACACVCVSVCDWECEGPHTLPPRLCAHRCPAHPTPHTRVTCLSGHRVSQAAEQPEHVWPSGSDGTGSRRGLRTPPPALSPSRAEPIERRRLAWATPFPPPGLRPSVRLSSAGCTPPAGHAHHHRLLLLGGAAPPAQPPSPSPGAGAPGSRMGV